MYNNKQCQVLTIKDVSEAQDLKKVQQKNTLLNLLTSTMSHELLTPISCMIELSTKMEANSCEGSTISTSTLIKNTGKLVLSQIKLLLDKGLIENEQFSLNLVQESIYDIVYSVVDIIRGQAKLKKIIIEIIKLSKLDRHKLLLDKIRIQQILLNWLSNAIKFSPQKSTVTVKLGVFVIDSENSRIMLSVSDQGIGISQNDQ